METEKIAKALRALLDALAKEGAHTLSPSQVDNIIEYVTGDFRDGKD